MADPSSFPSKIANLNGNDYFYVDQPAIGKPKGTIVLVHGWPDSWYGWRHQIPFLSKEGYRVLCISQLGFGHGTHSPTSIERYAIKQICADFAALLKHEKVKSAVFWGHDWGGAVVYRMALYYPTLVRAVIALSTPYFPPAKGTYKSLEEQAKGLPQFRYQLYLASDEPMRDFSTKQDFRKFFNAMFQPAGGHVAQFDKIAAADKWTPTPLLSPSELEVYVEQYHAEGLQSSTNWYRTRKINFDDDVKDFEGKEGKLEGPVLFIATDLDKVLSPNLSIGMEKYIPKLTRKSVKTAHWGLFEAKDEVNGIVGEFLMRLHLEQMRHRI